MSLRKPFERVLNLGHKLDDKCLRNELCILINYVVTSSASHKFFLERETPSDMTFLEAMIYYSTHDELNQQINFLYQHSENSGSGSKKPLFTTRDEDVEFKKLLWTCVLYVVREKENTEAHNCLIDNNFLDALLIYLDPNNHSISTQRW